MAVIECPNCGYSGIGVFEGIDLLYPDTGQRVSTLWCRDCTMYLVSGRDLHTEIRKAKCGDWSGFAFDSTLPRRIVNYGKGAKND